MLGYFDLPDATAATIDADGWLHTGDLGVMDERGYVRVTGRGKDMIIRGGENIDPREIEDALIRHPGVAGAAVLGLPDPDWGEQVAAVIVPAGAPPAAADLRDHMRALLAPYKTPRHWYLGEAIPVNAMGKVQKFLLRRQIDAGRLTGLP
jgi:acyl-CoA synthetase (AMP-forming)/AMP-acid ligase II